MPLVALTGTLSLNAVRGGAPDASKRWGLDRGDLIALGLIVLGYVIALLFMPLQRNFPILDDWTFARSAEKVVSGMGFVPSEIAQMTLVTHAYWGAFFLMALGPGFTSLTIANMVMSFAAVVTFYLLLRRLDFTLQVRLAGVAVLALNPYYLNLSYSYMTEITFVALLLLSCLLYIEGLRGREVYLWVGSLFAALLFLARQFGLAVPLAVVLWLLLAGRWSWRRVAAVVLLPAVAAVGYFAWSSGFGTTFSGSVGREEILALVRNPATWVTRASHFIYLETFLPGLMVPLFVRVRHWKLALLLSLAVALVVFGLWQVKSNIVQQGQGSVAELSYEWLRLMLPDPTIVYCVGAALSTWLAVGLVEGGWPGAVALLRRKREPDAFTFLYMTGIILFAGTYLVSLGFLDRYWMPLWPIIIVAGLAQLKGRSLRALAVTFAVLAVTATFGVLLHLDQYNALAARWEAGTTLVAQGVPYEKIENGAEWDGYYLYDEALSRLPSHDVLVIGRIFPPSRIIDPQYVIGTKKLPGYRVVATYPYVSRLGGWVERLVLVMERD